MLNSASRFGDLASSGLGPADATASGWRQAASLLVVGSIYFALAKLGLALASINPSASPIWPPTGFALAATLLAGYRVWPAILVAAFAANVTTAGSIATSLAIAVGNSIEALVTAYAINRWAGGSAAFDAPVGVTRFAAFSFVTGPPISATIGIGSLTMAGYADWDAFGSLWVTWWLGDVTGALLITPAIVLWAQTGWHFLPSKQIRESVAVVVAAVAVGIVAFSPLMQQTQARGPLAFLAIVPLVMAALRSGQRETATAALLLACFAVWGTMMHGGPFSRGTLNESFLMLLGFIIAVSMPSLILSADVAARRRTEDDLRSAYDELEQRVKQRTTSLEQAIAALQTEVEERREIETEIQQQRIHLQEAQRLAVLGSWVWDVASGKLTWSRQLYEIYGVKPEEFGGTFDDYIKRIHPDDRERVKADISHAMQTGASFQGEERIVRPDGEIRHLHSTGEVIRDEQGRAVRMLGVCQDVTDRKHADAALHRSEQQYRLLVDSVQDYAIVMLDPQGRIMSWNAGAARINRYSAQEILDRHFSVFYTEHDRVGGEPARVLELARNGKFETEGWRVRKDGSRFWASVVIDPIHDADGTLLGFAKVTRDITERHQAQEALDEAREKMAQAQKMEALGQLTGGIAHDFNNLLMIVSGHAEILRRGNLNERQIRATDAIITAAGRGQSLTHQLLAFARRQPLAPIVIDIKQRIAAVREMLGSSLRGNIQLVEDFPEDLWLTKVDPNQLELALVNMAVNARDAMPDGGTFTLSGRNVTATPDRLAGDRVGEFVALTISDTGVGIRRELLHKVFEPFFTTKAVGKGTGLGLSQVYGFALQSGGAATIDSEVGQGTRITIYLPRSTEPLPAAADAPAPLPGKAAEGTVLMVEDSSEVADVTSTLLAQLGYRVVRADSPADALERLEHERVDLLFSDVVMPGPMDGIALAHEVKKRFPHLPVLLTSGYSEMAGAAGRDFPILRKPFQLNALEQVLREVMDRRPEAAKRS